MKKEYDFSKAEKGKFYKEDAEIYLPVYLDPDLNDHFNKLAIRKKKDINLLINDILRNDVLMSKNLSL
jgi:hypothetical protein